MPRFASVAASLLAVSAIFSAGYHVGYGIASKYHVWVTAFLGLANIALAMAGGLSHHHPPKAGGDTPRTNKRDPRAHTPTCEPKTRTSVR